MDSTYRPRRLDPCRLRIAYTGTVPICHGSFRAPIHSRGAAAKVGAGYYRGLVESCAGALPTES